MLAYRPSGGRSRSRGHEEQLADGSPPRSTPGSRATWRRATDLAARTWTTCSSHWAEGRAPLRQPGAAAGAGARPEIAEIENLRAELGRPPLLLLDDVSSELDPEKNGYLLGHVAALPAQAFLTSTDRRLIEPVAGAETRSSSGSPTARSSEIILLSLPGP